MSNIARAREGISLLRQDLKDMRHEIGGMLDILSVIEIDIARRPGIYRNRKSRAKMTPVLRQRIKAWAARYPGWDNQRIAEKFNVTNARVSEILHP